MEDMRFFDLLDVPLGLKHKLSSSRRDKLMVCGLDHSGSQAFNYSLKEGS